MHTTQSFQEQNSNSRFVLSGCRIPALPTPVLLGSVWSGGFHGHRALGSCHSLCSLSDILKQVSTVYLCPGCSAPEPSVPREHQVDFTRTRPGWVCAHSIPSVVACCAACYHPTHQGSAASPQEQSRRLTQQQVITDGTVTCQTHPSSRKGTAGAAHQVTYPSAAPVTPSRCCHPVAGPVGERQPAGQQRSLYSVE